MGRGGGRGQRRENKMDKGQEIALMAKPGGCWRRGRGQEEKLGHVRCERERRREGGRGRDDDYR